jgi:hypothetical protein
MFLNCCVDVVVVVGVIQKWGCLKMFVAVYVAVVSSTCVLKRFSRHS